MNQFSLLNYLLILFAIFSHYPYGKRLGIKQFFPAVLVGLSFSGLVVGILANFFAGLIRPYIFLIVFVGALLLIIDSIRLAKRVPFINFKEQLARYLVVLVLGAVLFILNNPSKLFFQQDNEKDMLLFNRHYSYYSSQSVEMVNAKYFSRLKIANLYPYEWSQYHFFNSGTQAVAQGLIHHPSLFSYWMTQTLVSILILISFLELFFHYFGFRLKNILIFAAWLIIGLSLFIDSLTWNLSTTGTFSVFAIIMLIFALYKKKSREIIVYSGILGASAFRLLPISFCFLTLALYFIFSEENPNLRLNLKNVFTSLAKKTKLILIDFISIFLFIAYPLITLISAKAGEEGEKITLFAKEVFDNGWANMLTGFKFIGFAYYLAFSEGLFSGFNRFGFFEKIILSPIKLRIFILVAAVVILLISISLARLFLKYRFRTIKWIAIIIFALLNYRFVSLGVAHLFLLSSFYFIAVTVLLFFIQERKKEHNGNFNIQIIALIFFGLLLQYIGLDFGIREPVLYIVYDVLLWGLIALMLYLFVDKKFIFYGTLLFSLLLPYLFPLQLVGILRMTEADRHFMKIDVSPILNSTRENFVDKNNMSKFQIVDANTADAYSSALGSNLKYSPDYADFLNYNFAEGK